MKQILQIKSSLWRGLLSLFFLMAMVGNAWGEDGDVFYTLTATHSSSNTAYASYYDVTINGLQWNAPGNQNTGSGWRIGGKSLTKVDRNITGKSKIGSIIGKVTLNHDGVSNSNLTVNSIKLTVASDANFSNIIETVTKSSPSVSSSGSIDFEPTGSDWAKDCYYMLTINVSNSNSSNYGLDVTSLVFYEGTESAADTRTAVNMSTFTTAGGVTSIVKGNTLATSVTNDQSGWTAAYTYSSDKESVATVDANGVITAVAKGTAKIKAALNVSASDASYKAGTTTYKEIEITVTNPPHHYTFSANGTTFSEGDVEEGSAITFPATTPADVNDMKFMGWYAGDYSNASTAPTYVSSATMGENDVTYKAVYAEASTGGTGYKLVSSLTEGKKYIFVTRNTAGNGYALASTVTTGTSVTVATSGDDKVISGTPANSIVWTRGAQYNSVLGSFDLQNVGTSTVHLKINGTSVTTADASYPTFWDSSKGLYGKSSTGTGSTTYYLLNSNGTFSKGTGSTTNRVYAYEEYTTTSYSDFTTSVAVKTLTGISFGGSLTKTVYTEEETFDPAGITVLASYDGQAEKEDVTSKATINYSTDPLTVGTTQVQVSASWKGQNCQDNYNITVNAIPTYTITASAATGGTYTVKIGDAEAANVPAEGTTYQSRAEKTITLTSVASEGYKLHSTPFVVKDAEDNKVDVSKSGDNYTFTMPAKAVTITAQFVQQYTITAGTCAKGSITAIKDKDGNAITATSKTSKVVVEVTPDEHYHATKVYYVKAGEETENEITATEGVYSFSMPASNVTVKANFEEDENHQAIFYANGNTHATVKYYVDQDIVFPADLEDVYGMKFVGWVAGSAITEQTDDKPDFVTSAKMGQEELKYYAVYANATDGSSSVNIAMGSTSVTSGNITVAAAQGTNSSSAPAYTSSECRIYAGNTITVSTTGDDNITAVSFTFHKQGSKDYFATVSANTGTYTSGGASTSGTDDKVDTWEGSAKSITFSTSGTGQRVLVSATVTTGGVSYTDYCTTVPSSAKITVSAAGYATYYNSTVAFAMPTNMEGYAWNNGLVKAYDAADVVPAGTALVLKAAEGDYTLNYTTGGTAPAVNALLGTDTETALTADENSYFYGLSLNAANELSSVGFYWMTADGAAFTNGAHKAYLKLPKSTGAPIMAFPFNDDATGVSEFKVQSSKLKDGKFIENGKIVIMKNGVKYNVAGQAVK